MEVYKPGNTQLDGDKDEIPCKKLWSGRYANFVFLCLFRFLLMAMLLAREFL
jgi:hypothetical protein